MKIKDILMRWDLFKRKARLQVYEYSSKSFVCNSDAIVFSTLETAPDPANPSRQTSFSLPSLSCMARNPELRKCINFLLFPMYVIN